MKSIHIKFSRIPIHIIFVIQLFTFLSCDSFVDVGLPSSQLNSDVIFQDYQTADAALGSIYSKIRDRGMLVGSNSGLSNKLGLYTDEMTPYGISTSGNFIFYSNSILPESTDIAEYWNSAYNQIYAANAVYQGVSKSTNLSPEQVKQLTGEALFIRSLLHFYLVNLYGEIPYITDTDYRKNSLVSRMSVQSVYEMIIKDLEQSEKNLTEDYKGSFRERPNKFTIKALLARTYLYNGLYEESSNAASGILNNTNLYSLEKDLNQVFLINSPESIWHLQPAVQGQNTLEGLQFIFQTGPPPVVSLNDQLVNSFSQNDLRKYSWIKSVSAGNKTWYHAYKYKEKNYTSNSVEYSIVFRLAEQYLIRAEARAHTGDLIGAKEDLNKIRNRAGLKNTVAVTKENILVDILEERKWELFSEFGHRFFDLKRFNEIDKQLSPVKSGWNSTDALFPVPQNELLANPNLKPQNTGY